MTPLSTTTPSSSTPCRRPCCSASSRSRTDSELQASRRRIATASATERRRIERDLHDSAQQQLVALRIHLDRASERLGRDEELEQVGVGLEQALHEIRAIAHGAYPAVLRDFGLGAALTEAARSDGRVRVKVGPLGRYGEEVEAAVYFAALEALQNAVQALPRGRAHRRRGLGGRGRCALRGPGRRAWFRPEYRA